MAANSAARPDELLDRGGQFAADYRRLGIAFITVAIWMDIGRRWCFPSRDAVLAIVADERPLGRRPPDYPSRIAQFTLRSERAQHPGRAFLDMAAGSFAFSHNSAIPDLH